MRPRTGGRAVLVALAAGTLASGCTLWEALANPWDGLGDGGAHDATADTSTTGSHDGGPDSPAEMGDACPADAGCAVTVARNDSIVALAIQGETLYALATNGDVLMCVDQPNCLMMNVTADGGAPANSAPVSDIVASDDAGPYWTAATGGIEGIGQNVVYDGGANALALLGKQLAWTFGGASPSAGGQGVKQCALASAGCMATTLANAGVASNVALYDTDRVAWAQLTDGGIYQVVSREGAGDTNSVITMSLSGPLPYFVASDGTTLCWVSQGTGVACCPTGGCSSATMQGGGGAPVPVLPQLDAGARGLTVRAGTVFVTADPDGGVLAYATIATLPTRHSVPLPVPPLDTSSMSTSSAHPVGPTSTVVAGPQFVFYVTTGGGIERVSWE